MTTVYHRHPTIVLDSATFHVSPDCRVCGYDPVEYLHGEPVCQWCKDWYKNLRRMFQYARQVGILVGAMNDAGKAYRYVQIH